MSTPRHRPLSRPSVLRWLQRQGLSQNAMAEAIGRDQSFVSKVLLGRTKSRPVCEDIRRFMANPKGYRVRPGLRQPAAPPGPRQIRKALAVLQDAAGG